MLLSGFVWYELEIIRLLYLLAPQNAQVLHMVNATRERLKTTCFGYHDDGVGECFDTSLIVLRFLATTSPLETVWIQSRIDNFNRHYSEKKRPWFCLWYFWLCLSELPFEIAKPELDKYKPIMLNWLENKSFVMHSEHDLTIHPVICCMLRNAIAKYPEYSYIKERHPYIGEKDRRLHFNLT